ncbi:nicotinate-nucleotide--dimethylbenzimidazole phosphoribosyltransferase [Proteinivorax tanatarense]|uniref:Nicotinate-nucleotide--dimethylbenzimidazole phosphoribosyltransferase n=1 Tax=Proteinivorax tanatarense TaxID=1260629 RepID=A0AAU7VJN1_9FIRM
MKLLQKIIKNIQPLDSEIMKKSRTRVDNLIKPPKSLGKLEAITVQLAGITKNIHPSVEHKAIIIMAADHGVYEEGVAPNPQSITIEQTLNFPKGLTGVCAIGEISNAKIVTVDIGINGELPLNSGVINKKIKYGTDNFAKGPAMTRKEAVDAIEVGIEIAQQQIKRGVNLIGVGEMGITNTTASTAILAVLGNIPPKEITGKGSGLDSKGIQHKIKVIEKAIDINKPDPDDGLDVLAKVGGLEIGGMAGVILGSAANRVPVVIDGYIATVSALIAKSIEPKVKDYLIPSHASMELGGKRASELLGVEPMLYMNMCLGEGSGAALAFPIIDAACNMNDKMITFKEASMNP